MFPNQPKYPSKEVPPKRTTPEEREKRLVVHDESVLKDWIEKDRIESFPNFCSEFENRLTKEWMSVVSNDNVSFFQSQL